MADLSSSLNFLVLHAATPAQLEGVRCGSGAVPPGATLLSTNMSPPEAYTAKPSAAVASAAHAERLGERPVSAGSHPHVTAWAEGESQTNQAEEIWDCRSASLVCMSLDATSVVPSALTGTKCVAETLREVWEGTPSVLPRGITHGSAESEDACSELSGCLIRKKRVEDLVQELVDIGFSFPQQQRMLNSAPLAAWARILPSVTRRYCQRRFALDMGNKKGADFVLYRHQNGSAASPLGLPDNSLMFSFFGWPYH